MSTQLSTQWSYWCVSFAMFSIASKLLYDYYLKEEKSRKPRIVRFNPKIEGHKFQRKEQSSSAAMEEAIKQHFVSVAEPKPSLELIPKVKGEFAFLIRNVLTTKECKQLIAAAEATGFEARRYSGKGDDSSSCCFQSDGLANHIVLNRIKPFLPGKSYFDADSSLTMNELNWFSSGNNQSIERYGTLYGLNTSCRVEKYQTKEHLKIHRDGCVLVANTKDVFTVYAIVIYLNDDYAGGYTRFCVDIDANPKDGKYPYSFLDVKGKAGDALVFRHEILHKGGVVDDGMKYILRLDAAYQMIR
mmetsp:Transcript_58910/g.93714  ORF Transcript_58910/g.93714 Transcript_58910/m.93714 type:complete len:301 (-) Transcript_58910:106-1008(-)